MFSHIRHINKEWLNRYASPPSTQSVNLKEGIEMPGLSALMDKIKSNPIAATLLIIGIALLGAIFWYISKGENLQTLESTDKARGLITFLIDFVTVSIAIILTIYVAVSDLSSSEVKERFAMGKEVFTALVGILGTIVGFYYGAANKNSGQPTQPGQAPSAQVHLASVNLSSQQLIKGQTPVTLEGKITGGTSPYSYAITFEPKNIIADIPPIESKDGNLKQELKVLDTATAGGNVGFQIDIKDKDGKLFVYKDDSKKILVKLQ
jgi:hypothetical protein